MLIGLAGRRQFGEQHRQEMQALGIDCQWVSSPNDLDNFDGLILSGLVSSDWPDLPDWINRLKDPLWQQRPLFADGWACSILAKSKTALMDYHFSFHSGFRWIFCGGFSEDINGKCLFGFRSFAEQEYGKTRYKVYDPGRD